MRKLRKNAPRELCARCQKIAKREREKHRKARRQGIKEQREACKRARKLHQQGAPIEEIADLFEVPIEQAKRMVLPGGQQGWHWNQSPLDLEQMRTLFAEGHTSGVIAVMMHCDESTVRKWRRRLAALSEADD